MRSNIPKVEIVLDKEGNLAENINVRGSALLSDRTPGQWDGWISRVGVEENGQSKGVPRGYVV